LGKTEGRRHSKAVFIEETRQTKKIRGKNKSYREPHHAWFIGLTTVLSEMNIKFGYTYFRSQFHQRFTRAFFVQNFGAKNHKAKHNKRKAAQFAFCTTNARVKC